MPPRATAISRLAMASVFLAAAFGSFAAARADAWQGAVAQFDLSDPERPASRVEGAERGYVSIWDERDHGAEFAVDVTLQNLELGHEGYWTILLGRPDRLHYELMFSGSNLYLREQPGARVIPSLARSGGETEQVRSVGREPYTIRLIALGGRLAVFQDDRLVGEYHDLAPLSGRLGFGSSSASIRFGPIRKASSLATSQRFEIVPLNRGALLLAAPPGTSRTFTFELCSIAGEQDAPIEVPKELAWKLTELDNTVLEGTARVRRIGERRATFEVPVNLREPHRLLVLHLELRLQQREPLRWQWFVASEKEPKALELPPGYIAGIWSRVVPRGDLSNRLTFHYARAAAASEDGFNFVHAVAAVAPEELDIYRKFGLKTGIVSSWVQSRPVKEHPAVHAYIYGDEPKVEDVERYLSGMRRLQGSLGSRPFVTALIGEGAARARLFHAFWAAPHIEGMVRFYPYRKATYDLLSPPTSYTEQLGVDTLAVLVALMPDDMPWYLVTQTFGVRGAEPYWRLPTPEEATLQLIVGNVFGASGYVAYSYEDPKDFGLVNVALRPTTPRLSQAMREFAESLAAWPRATLGKPSTPVRSNEIPWRVLSRRLSDGTVALVNLDTKRTETFVAPQGFRPASAYGAVSRAVWLELPDGHFQLSIPAGNWAVAEAPATWASRAAPSPLAGTINDVLARFRTPNTKMPNTVELSVPGGPYDLIQPPEPDAAISLVSLLKILDVNRQRNYELRLRSRKLDAATWRLSQVAMLNGAYPVKLQTGQQVSLAPLGKRRVAGLPRWFAAENRHFRLDVASSNALLRVASREMGTRKYIFVINLDPSGRQSGTIAVQSEHVARLRDLVSNANYECKRSAIGTRDEIALDLGAGEMAVFDWGRRQAEKPRPDD